MKKISIVVPMYNEQEVAKEFYNRTISVLTKLIEYDYEIIVVNDGSRDKTLEILLNIVREDEHVKVINFSRNFGHQAAITAGIENATGDAIITIDADLQDPPEIIVDMIREYEKGY